MSELIISASLTILILAVVLWLLQSRRHAAKPGPSVANLKLESYLPRHYLYFQQICQALSVSDTDYLRRVAPREVAQRAYRERRAVARKFLAGLHEDFTNLERLGRIVAALSPVISRQQEIERLLLGVQFRFLYAWVWLRLAIGRAPLLQLEQLTGLVGRLATRMEQSMAAVGTLSAPGLDTGYKV
jgi:hypothetical protein